MTKIDNLNTACEYTLTCVSSFFPVKNKHNNDYIEYWFKHTLAINCPYVFFTNKDTINIIKHFRKDLPTYYIECELEDFYLYKFKDNMITHPRHCPSIELNIIWNEKMFMIQKAAEINPFHSEWFKWIDAGICTYRYESPPNSIFPNQSKLIGLPKDKFIYSSSYEYNKHFVTNTDYYHHISGTFLLHKSIINKFTTIYKEYINKLIDKNNIWTEQVIFTHIYKDYPGLFFKLCDGYGEIVKYLY